MSTSTLIKYISNSILSIAYYLSIEAEYDFIGPEVCSKTDTQFKVCASYDVARTISNFETLLLCFSRAQTF